jgi:ATP-binding cassette subfamily C protein CydC
LKLYGADVRQRRTVDETTLDLVRDQRRMAQVTGFSSALSQILANFAVWSVLFIGLARHGDGTLSAPVLVMMVLATMALFEASAPLPLAYQYLGRTRAAAARILQIARQKPAIRDPGQPAPPPAGNSLGFEGVTFGYDPARPVLRGLSLTIADGEKVALLGPSGVGKSTLISLALRLEDPQAGQVRLGGTDIATLDREILWDRMAYMSQRSQIFAGTIRDNLYLGNPTAEDAALYDALAAANLDRFVDELPDGLDTWVGENGVSISGGQARRLALARVILKDSPVLLLDEPTEGLDDATRTDLFDRLMPVAAGRTVLMITHQRRGLKLFDRVLTLDSNGAVADVPG